MSDSLKPNSPAWLFLLTLGHHRPSVKVIPNLLSGLAEMRQVGGRRRRIRRTTVVQFFDRGKLHADEYALRMKGEKVL